MTELHVNFVSNLHDCIYITSVLNISFKKEFELILKWMFNLVVLDNFLPNRVSIWINFCRSHITTELLLPSIRVWKGMEGPADPVSPLLFYKNLASHFLFILLSHIPCAIWGNFASRKQSKSWILHHFLVTSWIPRKPFQSLIYCVDGNLLSYLEVPLRHELGLLNSKFRAGCNLHCKGLQKLKSRTKCQIYGSITKQPTNFK